MLGNDLPPRHIVGQTLSNVRFILDHEPAHPELDTRWYLNRIVHRDALLSVLRLLVERNATFVAEPFNTTAFRAETALRGPVSRRSRDVLRGHVFGDSAFTFPFRRALAWDAVFDERNQFVIRNNAARNDMIRLAFEAGAQYAMPWDGNCFINERAWVNISGVIKQHDLLFNNKNASPSTVDNETFINRTTSINTNSTIRSVITTTVTTATNSTTNRTTSSNSDSDSTASTAPSPHNYFFVPMARIIDNTLLLNASYMPPTVLEEPQLIFARTAVERFDESKPYGRRPKVDLLWRLRVPGPWGGFTGMRRWRESSDVADGHPVLPAGWTARLSSGMPHLEGPGKGSARGASRTDGVERITAAAAMRALQDERGLKLNESFMVYNMEVLHGAVKAVMDTEGTGGEEVERMKVNVTDGVSGEVKENMNASGIGQRRSMAVESSSENTTQFGDAQEDSMETVTARILVMLLTHMNETSIPDLSSTSSSDTDIGRTNTTSTSTAYDASLHSFSPEAAMLFRSSANAAVHAVFRWMLVDQSTSAQLRAREALAAAFEVNATLVAAYVKDHAMTACALLDAARAATWGGGVWSGVSGEDGESDEHRSRRKEDEENRVAWATELANALEEDELSPWYSSKEREVLAALERGIGNSTTINDNETGRNVSGLDMRGNTTGANTSTVISNMSVTATTGRVVANSTFTSSMDADRPPFYRRGADGIALELCAACAHIFLSASAESASPGSNTSSRSTATAHFLMALRRTALARQRLAWYVDMGALADVSDVKDVSDDSRHDMSNAATLRMDARTLGLWMLHASVARTVDVDVWGYALERNSVRTAMADRKRRLGKRRSQSTNDGEDSPEEEGNECKAWLPAVFDRVVQGWDERQKGAEDERSSGGSGSGSAVNSGGRQGPVNEEEEQWRRWIRWTGRCAGRARLDGIKGAEHRYEEVDEVDDEETGARKKMAGMSVDAIVAIEDSGRKAGLPPLWTVASVDCRWMV